MWESNMSFQSGRFSNVTSKIIARMSKEIACEAFGIAHSELMVSNCRNAKISFARQTAIYLAHIAGQLTLTETAICFRRDRSTVSYACIIVEDRRDSPIFDLQLNYMEKRLRERIYTARKEGVFSNKSVSVPFRERGAAVC